MAGTTEAPGDADADTDYKSKESSDKKPSEAPTESKPLPNKNDFVIREGFPALRVPRSNKLSSEEDGGPWIDGDAKDEPIPIHDFWSCRDTFDFGIAASNGINDSLAALHQDCRTVFSARTRDDCAPYSAGVTYFWPSVLSPRCALEGLVAEIFKQHTKHLEPGVMIAEASGAEWWTLVLDDDDDENNKAEISTKSIEKSKDSDEDEEESDEVGLHFDADYGLEDQAPHLFLHPRLATVTYLTNYGAPTIILQKRSPPPHDVEKKSLNGSIKQGWVSHPRLGKHIAFDGRLLHGAPATFFPGQNASAESSNPVSGPSDGAASLTAVTEDSKLSEPPLKRQKLDPASCESASPSRITLLVNVWINHCPLDAEPLDDDLCKDLTCRWQGADGKSDPDFVPPFVWKETATPAEGSGDTPSTVSVQPNLEDPAGEEEVVIGNRLVTAFYNSSMKDLHRACHGSSDVIQLEFQAGSLELKVGDEVTSDDDQD